MRKMLDLSYYSLLPHDLVTDFVFLKHVCISIIYFRLATEEGSGSRQCHLLL